MLLNLCSLQPLLPASSPCCLPAHSCHLHLTNTFPSHPSFAQNPSIAAQYQQYNVHIPGQALTPLSNVVPISISCLVSRYSLMMSWHMWILCSSLLNCLWKVYLLSSFPVIFSRCSLPGVLPSSIPGLDADTAIVCLWCSMHRQVWLPVLQCGPARGETCSSMRAGTYLRALHIFHHC